MAQQHEAQRTPEQHTQHISDLLEEAQRECRTEISDPGRQALFAMLAEILGGAMKALHDYQSKGHERKDEQFAQERQLAIDIDQIEPSSKASIAVPYD